MLDIHNTSHHLGRRLLGAFHKDILTINGHLHGIKAHDLLNGFRGSALHYLSGHGKIFQLIIHEVDTIILGTFGKSSKCFRHRSIAEVMADTLGMDGLELKHQ